LGEKNFMRTARRRIEGLSYYTKQSRCSFFVGVEPPDVNGYPSLHSD